MTGQACSSQVSDNAERDHFRGCARLLQSLWPQPLSLPVGREYDFDLETTFLSLSFSLLLTRSTEMRGKHELEREKKRRRRRRSADRRENARRQSGKKKRCAEGAEQARMKMRELRREKDGDYSIRRKRGGGEYESIQGEMKEDGI